jgi:hypothetical protein
VVGSRRVPYNAGHLSTSRRTIRLWKRNMVLSGVCVCVCVREVWRNVTDFRSYVRHRQVHVPNCCGIWRKCTGNGLYRTISIKTVTEGKISFCFPKLQLFWRNWCFKNVHFMLVLKLLHLKKLVFVTSEVHPLQCRDDHNATLEPHASHKTCLEKITFG